MSVSIRLLGRPCIESDAAGRPVRGHKAWGLLAYLLLSDRPPARQRLASLLFSAAADPLAALRWNLAELRRSLGSETSIGGDPVRLVLPAASSVDVLELTTGKWSVLAPPPGELLEYVRFDGCPGFDTWMLVSRRRFAALIEGILVDRVHAALASGSLTEAIDGAGRLVEMNPLDEKHQALLVQCLADSGDHRAADAQLAAATKLFRSELGVELSESLRASAARLDGTDYASGKASVQAKIDAGRAAIAAGAIDAAVLCLRSAVVDAEASRDQSLLARALTTFGASLLRVGTNYGDAEPALRRGLATAEAIADRHSAIVANRELGFLNIQAGYRVEGDRHLAIAAELAVGDDSQLASIQAIQGMSLSDKGQYAQAVEILEASIERAQRCSRHRKVAWALAMLGRVHLVCGEFAVAAEALDEARRIARLERWSAFLPWPETLGAEVDLALGHATAARNAVAHAHALAEHVNDTGLQAFAGRGLALVARHEGDRVEALARVEAARLHAFRGSRTYVWIQAEVAALRTELLAERPKVDDSLEEWMELTARAGLAESASRAYLKAAQLGRPGAYAAAVALASDIDNQLLHEQIAAAADE